MDIRSISNLQVGIVTLLFVAIIMTSANVFASDIATSHLVVRSVDQNGNEFSGQWVELWQNGEIIDENFTPYGADVQAGTDYQVNIYDDPNEGKFFDHWGDNANNTERMQDVNISNDTEMIATFNVDQPNDQPDTSANIDAVPDTAQTTMGVPVSIDVLTNDSDPDGDSLTVDAITSEPSNGTVVINPIDNTIVYQPNPLFTGEDSFEYEVTDGNGDFDTATVTVTVN